MIGTAYTYSDDQRLINKIRSKLYDDLCNLFDFSEDEKKEVATIINRSLSLIAKDTIKSLIDKAQTEYMAHTRSYDPNG